MIKVRYIAPWRLSSEALFVVDSRALTSVSGQRGGSKGSHAAFLFLLPGFPTPKCSPYMECNVKEPLEAEMRSRSNHGKCASLI